MAAGPRATVGQKHPKASGRSRCRREKTTSAQIDRKKEDIGRSMKPESREREKNTQQSAISRRGCEQTIKVGQINELKTDESDKRYELSGKS